MKITKITNYYHAGHLYSVAKNASSNKETDENDPLISIMFSVLALEAFINESGSLAKMMPSSQKEKIVEGFSSVMSELEDRKEALLVKYHMALLVFSGATWDEGAQPFQDFKLLITLRNAIVHMKADKWETETTIASEQKERELKQYPKFIKVLKQKGLISIPETSTSWLEVISNPKVGQWACQTAELITKEFTEKVPDGNFKKSLENYAFGESNG
ncbi:hypothetical protein AB833_00235 [Chromatiales bacterium (ex Bugula neritina AB1)]|nr:hypothetical protein AB833_00720 [Chromatiales bacterium (ex Bugula neritina AB1)]OED45075.1 hypothetical protein AB833_00235 [Chromatiales bacterium (ex Bugula neritina AB1)]